MFMPSFALQLLQADFCLLSYLARVLQSHVELCCLVLELKLTVAWLVPACSPYAASP